MRCKFMIKTNRKRRKKRFFMELLLTIEKCGKEVSIYKLKAKGKRASALSASTKFPFPAIIITSIGE